jgi:hypothetical protein
MNLSIIRSCRPHAGIVFGAVEERPGPIGILPGACAQPKRSRVERSAAPLLGCDPGNLALRRCGTGGGGVSRPPSVPLRATRATEGDLRKPNRGWRPSGTGLRPHEPKTIPAWKRLLHCWDWFIPRGTESRDKLSASSDFSAFQQSKRQLAWTRQ